MSIGKIIKFERIKKGMTQAELADGIISVSHLSKIENNHTEPSEEIKECLLERLQLDLSNENVFFDDSIKNKLNEWKALIIKHDYNAASEIYKNLKIEINKTNEFSLLIYFKLFEVLFLQNSLKKEVDNHYIESIVQFENDLNDEQRYFYKKVLGDYFYYKEDYITSLQHLKDAQQLLFVVSEKEEEADFNYIFALVNSHLENLYAALEYGKRALELYQKLYNFKYCIKCHILISIQYSRLRLFSNGKASLLEARQLALTIGYEEILGTINHNLGHIFSLEGNSQKALELFKESYKMKNETMGKLVTVKSIIQEFMKRFDNSQALNWTDQALELIKEDRTKYQSVYLEIKMYKYVLQGETTNFESFILNEALPYANSKGNLELKALFMEYLADYYRDLGKYKNACNYYIKSKDIYKKLKFGGIIL